jgi:hypothetical protein
MYGQRGGRQFGPVELPVEKVWSVWVMRDASGFFDYAARKERELLRSE